MMGTSRVVFLALLLSSGAAWSREAASLSACQAAAAEPAIRNAKAALEHVPQDLKASFRLADAWSDAGCFTDAVNVLQTQLPAHPDSQELQTRLRVARSLVGEEHFFDNIDRADAEAKLKRATFRCSSLGDLDACNEALRLKPGDSGLLSARAEAAARTNSSGGSSARSSPSGAGGTSSGSSASGSAGAASAFLRQGESAPPAVAKLQVGGAASNRAASRRFSNAAPESQSH